jgi:hypothetical protein
LGGSAALATAHAGVRAEFQTRGAGVGGVLSLPSAA